MWLERPSYDDEPDIFFRGRETENSRRLFRPDPNDDRLEFEVHPDDRQRVGFYVCQYYRIDPPLDTGQATGFVRHVPTEFPTLEDMTDETFVPAPRFVPKPRR